MPGSYAEKVKREKRKKAKKDEKTERMFLYKKKGEKETQKEKSGFLRWKKFHMETGARKGQGKGSKWVSGGEEISHGNRELEKGEKRKQVSSWSGRNLA